ncbi:MAG: hypothetical protein M3P46_06200 [Actinomycetota bacterium]|nr:hypothetical protein [Actinomycetota bacterium]
MTEQAPLLQAVRGLVCALQARLGDAVEVEDEPLGGFVALALGPTRTAGCPVSLLVDEHKVIVELSSLSGRWELGRTEADLHLLDRLLRGVTECGVVEVWAHRRSEVTVLLPGGGRESETGYDGCTTALVPLPFWRRWGRRTVYQPYVPIR